MLVLSRKIGEQIVIGEGIVVVVKKVSGKRVTLGIEAPSGMRIVRRELKPLEAPSQEPPAGLAPTAPTTNAPPSPATSPNGEALSLPLGDVWNVTTSTPEHH